MFIATLEDHCCLIEHSSAVMYKTILIVKYEDISVCLKMSLILLRSLEDEKRPSYAFQIMMYHYFVNF